MSKNETSNEPISRTPLTGWLAESELYDAVTFDGGGGVDDVTTASKLNRIYSLTAKYGNPADIAELERKLEFKTEQIRTLNDALNYANERNAHSENEKTDLD